MNQMANLCERVGANINSVRMGIGSDSRIGQKFLHAGTGYGGSCFPKDVKALIRTGIEGYPLELIEAVDNINEEQKKILFHKLHNYYNGQLEGKTIAVWGLSFKPQTDDIRQAPYCTHIPFTASRLPHKGLRSGSHGPGFQDGTTVTYAKDMYEAAEGAHADSGNGMERIPYAFWEQLRQIMHTLLVLDGRNIYQPQEVKDKGFTYIGINNKQDKAAQTS